MKHNLLLITIVIHASSCIATSSGWNFNAVVPHAQARPRYQSNLEIRSRTPGITGGPSLKKRASMDPVKLSVGLQGSNNQRNELGPVRGQNLPSYHSEPRNESVQLKKAWGGGLKTPEGEEVYLPSDQRGKLKKSPSGHLRLKDPMRPNSTADDRLRLPNNQMVKPPSKWGTVFRNEHGRLKHNYIKPKVRAKFAKCFGAACLGVITANQFITVGKSTGAGITKAAGGALAGLAALDGVGPAVSVGKKICRACKTGLNTLGRKTLNWMVPPAAIQGAVP